jgi:hypothetical protein
MKKYEIPDGRSSGEPRVIIARSVVEALGMPEVNYGSLHKFMTDELGMPYSSPINIELYGKKDDNSRSYGFYLSFTRTVHINSPMSEQSFPRSGGTMRILAHEGRHMSDFFNRKLMNAGNFATKLSFYGLSYKVISAESNSIPIALLGVLEARRVYYSHLDITERRAFKQELEPSTLAHEGDIFFPNSSRALIIKQRQKNK